MKFIIFILFTTSFVPAQKSFTKEKITQAEYTKYAKSSYSYQSDSDEAELNELKKLQKEIYKRNYFQNTYNYFPDSVIKMMNKNNIKRAYIGSNKASGSSAYFRLSEAKKSIKISFEETGLMLTTEFLPAVSNNGKYLAIYTIKSEFNEEIRKNAFTVINNNEEFSQVFAIASRKWTPFGICFDDDNHVLLKVKPKKKAADKSYFDYYRYKIKKLQDLNLKK